MMRDSVDFLLCCTKSQPHSLDPPLLSVFEIQTLNQVTRAPAHAVTPPLDASNTPSLPAHHVGTIRHSGSKILLASLVLFLGGGGGGAADRKKQRQQQAPYTANDNGQHGQQCEQHGV